MSDRVIYTAERTCCDDPGEVTAYLTEDEACGVSQIQVDCLVCGTTHIARETDE